jgi:DNA-binding SARP family transcriptional activator
MTVRARLLGQLTLEDGSNRHVPSVDKRVGLLAYLAWADDWVARDRLSFLFWPDVPPGRARSNLRGLLARARRLPFATDLEVEDAQIRWLVASDVRVFREALARRDWDALVEAYGGPFLEGVSLDGVGEVDAWIETEREAFRSVYRTALFAVCRQRQRGDAGASLVPRLERLLADDPYDEEAAR